MDGLLSEIVKIALPAAVGLAADPLASLVDTMFIGRLGAVEVAAVGVSISVFNLVSKILNIPLLNITTSFVAEENVNAQEHQLVENSGSEVEEGLLPQSRLVLPAVSSSLALGTVLGVLETTLLISASSIILDIMGIPFHSVMRVPARQYLVLRSLAAPAVVVSLAVQGAFRGFKDTKTPLYATAIGNVVHIVLDPLLMFFLKLGVLGAAAATVISEYIMLLILLYKLKKFVVLLPIRRKDLALGRFLKSGGLLLLRTLGTLLTTTLATSVAARLGTIPMAAHQICVQIWLAASLLSDSLALAAQAIIAEALVRTDYDRVKHAAYRVVQIGLGFGVLITLLLLISFKWLLRLFTHDNQVIQEMTTLMPFVVGTQAINSLAFVLDGIFYGGSDFQFSALSTVSIGAVSSVVLYLGSLWLRLRGIWVGLSLFMCLRVALGFLRLGSATGPWRFLKNDYKEVLTVSV